MVEKWESLLHTFDNFCNNFWVFANFPIHFEPIWAKLPLKL